MQTYQVTLINQSQDFERTIEIPATEEILAEAVEHDIKIPFECTIGSCGTCLGKLVTGTVDQSGQIFLTGAQVDEGQVLTCVAKPTSDCTIEVELSNYLV
ncbi:MAG: 2Fe-2S iron-sulfur cluster-binding protein [Leptolyngbyaceae bacterium]|nr:2Fe-2S iron-sulfur cluster-binding protein [Leptolyngbyaceae bacterium]